MASRNASMAQDASTAQDTHPEASESTPLIHPPNPQDDPEVTIIQESLPLPRVAAILATAWFGVFVGAADSTIMATLSAPISSTFHSLTLLSWLITAYLIANAACQPISGRLTDIFGRGPGLVLCNLLFAAGNLICGLAESEGVMILGRVVAGMGGGGLMSISTFLGSDLVPLRMRGLVQGVGNLCYGSGAMLGGVLGGLLNDTLGWRWAFLIQVPSSLVSAALAAWLIRVPPKLSNKSLVSRIDFPGVLLTVLFLVVLLLGLNAGGNITPWIHPLPLTALPLSAAIFALWIFWETRAAQPVIPVRLLWTRTIFFACMANFFTTMVTMLALYYTPLYLQVLGYSASQAGLRILTASLGTSTGSLVSGAIMRYTGKYRLLGVALLIVQVCGMCIFVTLDETSSSWLCALALFLGGSGYSGMLTVTLVAVTAAADHSQQAVVTSALCTTPFPISKQS